MSASLRPTCAKAAATRPQIDVAAVGICGSVLHYYKDGGIGSAIIHQSFIPGHEFGGPVTEDLPETRP
jgi:L-iditol 2-dehydrogenase